MASYVITVDFTLDPPRFPEFLRLIRENAAASLREEPGCRHFDVCTPRDGSPRVFLYEVYVDEAAFKAHLQSAHYKTFAEAAGEIGDLVKERRLGGPYDLRDDPTAEVLGDLPV